MKNKFYLAIISVAVQIFIWIFFTVFPSVAYISDAFGSVLRAASTLSIFGTVPFFLALLRNKQLLAEVKKERLSDRPVENKGGLVKHILYRVSALIALLLFCYLVILGGRSDPMGLGLVYAFLAAALIAVIALLIDTVRLYRRDKESSGFYANIIFIVILVFTLISIL